MKFTLSILERRSEDSDAERRWPHYIFGGRVRTSTFVLIIAFFAVWWVYDTYRPEPAPKPPTQQVVPPGFVPDPNYTWVPRSRVQQPPATDTYTPTPTSTPPPPPVTTTTTTPPVQLPQLPCLLPAPFCPPSTSPPTPPPQLPQPGPGPAPGSPPPAS
ncbi:hypothetical protein [Mycobacterium nebraskense]|uniref:Proline rich protein n=1 Tax=Mycobacterium nebraskense TaxID=244292 RepID=A0A1X1ZVB4_9MYCO|nr:hypothetical protein [Mycobacterium nebraskense]KKC05413.1 hypothetical protein WU83_08545 [Mycobacterium nebraskense]MBI2695504.1 hypothetical protein [Mycobacterium nebraskense]MCV7116603.1 hypothetical protein [Mycobacterium nebraskense]ORW27996.1 hypothetical protein AWC17_28535 [Mycobacterium nebraskense]